MIDIIKIKSTTLVKIISRLLPEILIIVGLFFIVFATFKINAIAGYYCLGGVLLLVGILLAKGR
jgi:hypothetical protein